MNIKIHKILAIVFLSLMSFNSIMAQSDSICLQIAKQSIDWLQNGQSEKLYQQYNKDVASKLDAKTTATIWSQITSQYGNFKQSGELHTQNFDDKLLIEAVLSFEHGNIKYRLSFDKQNKISGIFFIPYKTRGTQNTETSILKETKCSFTNAGIEFPALLCMPKGNTTKAIVIFVHGSGPNDMDETIGPNKIFKQMAHKLAINGIASLRYHKRTYLVQQGKAKNDFQKTLDNIATNDALAAIDFVKNNDSLSQYPIIIIGHSLGAYLAPRIASKSPSVKGIVMMAGNAQPLEDLILEQYQYLYAPDGYSKAEKEEIADIKKKVKNVKKLGTPFLFFFKRKIKELPLTNDTSFWMSIKRYNALKTYSSLKIPILNIGGTRDYQVPEKNLDLWKVVGGDHQDAIYIHYKGLNHLFMKGEGKSFPREYNHKGNISENMMSEVSNWIKEICSEKENKKIKFEVRRNEG